MTDLAYCHNHMTDELIGSADALTELEEELLNEGWHNGVTLAASDLNSSPELDIPLHAIPPNPDESEALPSQVHPSYPYGDPTNVNHPASRPRTEGDPTSRTLFVDSIYTGVVTATLRWDELALDHLLPVDKAEVNAESAAVAREIATRNIQAHHIPRADTIDEEGEDENQG